MIFMIIYDYNVKIGTINFSCCPTFWKHSNSFQILPKFMKFIRNNMSNVSMAFSWILKNPQKFKIQPPGTKRVIPIIMDTLNLVPNLVDYFQKHFKITLPTFLEASHCLQMMLPQPSQGFQEMLKI